MDPIPSPDLTPSLDSSSKLKTEVRVSLAQEKNMMVEIEDPAFGYKISQLVFTPSPSPPRTATSDYPVSKHNSEKSEKTVPLDLPSHRSPTFRYSSKKGRRRERKNDRGRDYFVLTNSFLKIDGKVVIRAF